MPKPLILAVASLFVAGLAGCASYRPAPVDLTRAAERFDARTLADPRLQRLVAAERPGAVPAAWDLDRLTLAALYFHPSLDFAYAKIATAQGATVTARQRPNPTLTLPSQIDPAAGGAWTVGAALNLLVETAGKRGARAADADALAAAAREDLAAAAWQVRGQVRTAMLDAWIGGQRTAITAHRLDVARALVVVLEHRLAVGEANALDLSRERANRDQAEMAWRDAHKAEVVARAQLAAAIGVSSSALEAVTLSFEGLDAAPREALASLRQAAVTGRPDVRAALARYQSAEAALRREIATQYPNLSLGAGYNDQGDKKVSLPVAFDLPIFNQNQGPIAEARGRRQEAAAQVRTLQAQAAGAFDAAALARAQTVQALASADRLLAEQQTRQRRTAKLLAAGEADRLALLAGDLEVSLAALSRLDALAAERQTLGQLEDAAQRPLLGAATRLEMPAEDVRAVAGGPR